MDVYEKSLKLHYDLAGKIEVVSRAKIDNAEDLSLAYSPGVAEPCRVIAKDYEESFKLTRRNNLVAVVTNGTAVLGLGDIGPAAGMPVMEGKCALFKRFADVDAFPICVDSKNVDEIVDTIAMISKSFGGINLEDISAPTCFEIEAKLKERVDIPVFHDDQHGTAIVTAAALINAIKLTKKPMGQLKMVINGAGAAGIAIAKLLIQMNFGEVIMVDRKGILYDGNPDLDPAKKAIAKLTNSSKMQGELADALKGADVLIGVSAPDTVSKEMVESMNEPLIFAMANPIPEIMPEDALEAGAKIVGTGRSDYPNQINNVLAFPGIFKGALSVRAREITDKMKERAAIAIAEMLPEAELRPDNIIISPLADGVADAVAKAVADCAIEEGVARI
ncbi:NAD(P)-dependent malic enzyme [Facklamia miroungae]|uniref:Malate dehydrogenase (Oxaloacetate-decarboxylating) n=1 Tax=Facklamia miroungae TaxID=120956 RepID=A0A1G7T5X5_9LACT|nr:NADP-dependent malic enzyme [Facklamia miroungae]NKZ29679.1 NADP-dependent malic enzyme [Facklamia miroungae]SDG30767.1 malate dehydrogenase (oxaloacetate-decarboxylating) [Facklamia miroungae]